MAQSKVDLSSLFGTALNALTSNRQQVNDLDGYNGNHGDNMVENVRLITEALQAKRAHPPAEALQYASQTLQKKGHGGTSQYYAQGLSQAAEQFRGQSSLDSNDAMTLVQSLLGSIPQQGHPQQVESGNTVLDQVIGLGAARSDETPQADDLDVGDVLSALLPAGLAFLQARQSGADTATAVGQALAGTLLGGQANPLQVGSPRAAAGGLIAQSILQALAGRR